MTDSRASQAYRLKSAGNLLERFYLEQGPGPGKQGLGRLRVTDPSVLVEFP